MKAKCIKKKPITRYQCFLYMIVPVLIGTLIAITSFANADWDKEDSLLTNLPPQQGWIEFKGEETL